MNRSLALLAAIVLVMSACKQEAPSTPDLPPPASRELPAGESRVEAVSGPIKLVLELRRTKVRASDPADAIYYRATLTNISTAAISVNGLLFTHPGEMSAGSASTYVELRDAGGKPAPNLIIPHGHVPGTVFDERLSPEQLEELKRRAVDGEPSPGALSNDSGLLAPGASLVTPDWSTSARLIPGWTQAPFELKPGAYELRLVYDWEWSTSFRKLVASTGAKPSPSAIRFKTAPLAVEVLP